MRHFRVLIGGLLSLALAFVGVAWVGEGASATAAPALVGAAISPGSVDVSTSSAVVTVSLHATSSTGVSEISVSVGNADTYGQRIDTSFGGFGNPALPAPQSGTATDGTWALPITLPTGALGGTWNLAIAEVQDAGGSSYYNSYGTAAPIPSPVPTFSVVDTNPDTAPPSVVGAIQVTPTTYDVSDLNTMPSFAIHLADPAGVKSAGIRVSAPGGYAWVNYTGLDLISGTSTDGVWGGTFDLPTNAENGTWTLSEEYLTDGLGNSSDGGPFPSELASDPHAASFTVINGTPAVPDAPTDVTGTASGDGDVSIDFDAPQPEFTPSVNGSPIHTFQIDYSSDNGATWSAPMSFSSEPEGYYAYYGPFNTGALDSGTYVFRVQATNSVGDSAWSTPSAPVHVVKTVPPGAPSSVTAVAGDGQATITWSAPVSDGGSPITDYLVEYSGDGSDWSHAFTGYISGTATSAVATGLVNGTGYMFRVIAENAWYTSAPSAPSALVTPRAATPAPPTPTPPLTSSPTPTASPTPSTSPACAASHASVTKAQMKLAKLKKHHGSRNQIVRAKKALTAALKGLQTACR